MNNINLTENYQQNLSLITREYCIGCGACKIASSGKLQIGINKYGMYQPDIKNIPLMSTEELKKVLTICPFSNNSLNETEISEKVFDQNTKYDPNIGVYQDLYIGFVAEQDYRLRGTSGGLITWLLAELLKTQKIDAVAHVKKSKDKTNSLLFEYQLSTSIEEIKDGAKSRYYPIEMSDVLKKIIETPNRYALVGLPCFIKAVRNLALTDKVINDRIVYYIGLVCGHLKSKAFADCFAWQVGIPPSKLEEIDFRVKLPNMPANQYGITCSGDDLNITKPVRQLIGCNWGHNLFRYPACDYCDDVFSETADIVVGDAWLPEYENDSGGNSLVITRNTELSILIKGGISSSRLSLSDTSLAMIVKSQAGGLRDRREGLAYRLFLKSKSGEWAPRKRVTPDKKHLSRQRRLLYSHRMKMTKDSHSIWLRSVNTNNMKEFVAFFEEFNKKYVSLYFSWHKKVIYNIKLFLKNLLSFLRN